MLKLKDFKYNPKLYSKIYKAIFVFLYKTTKRSSAYFLAGSCLMLNNFWKTNYSHKCNFHAMNKWDHNPIYFFAFWNCSCISYTNIISPLLHGLSNSIYQYFLTQSLWWIIFKKYADFIRTLGKIWINMRVYMCICISSGYPCTQKEA